MTGVKLWSWLRAAYYACLLCSARAATAPASLVALGRWEGANVSGQLASHTRKPTTPPGYQHDSIGAFAIRAGETVGSSLEGLQTFTVDDVIDSSMTLVMALTLFAAELSLA